ncbi:Uncharacterised protein [Chlamydia trachomatis]|nr:Uncharacterised protein [Chlamydia trachomatis]
MKINTILGSLIEPLIKLINSSIKFFENLLLVLNMKGFLIIIIFLLENKPVLFNASASSSNVKKS